MSVAAIMETVHTLLKLADESFALDIDKVFSAEDLALAQGTASL